MAKGASTAGHSDALKSDTTEAIQPEPTSYSHPSTNWMIPLPETALSIREETACTGRVAVERTDGKRSAAPTMPNRPATGGIQTKRPSRSEESYSYPLRPDDQTCISDKDASESDLRAYPATKTVTPKHKILVAQLRRKPSLTTSNPHYRPAAQAQPAGHVRAGEQKKDARAVPPLLRAGHRHPAHISFPTERPHRVFPHIASKTITKTITKTRKHGSYTRKANKAQTQRRPHSPPQITKSQRPKVPPGQRQPKTPPPTKVGQKSSSTDANSADQLSEHVGDDAIRTFGLAPILLQPTGTSSSPRRPVSEDRTSIQAPAAQAHSGKMGETTLYVEVPPGTTASAKVSTTTYTQVSTQFATITLIREFPE